MAREKIKGIIKHSIPEPEPVNSHLCFQGYWLMKGLNEVETPEKVNLFTILIEKFAF